MASREASAFRKRLLQALVVELGDEWKLCGASLMYRNAPPYLVQWISLDSSRFSTDFNVSCYVQILAHQADFWSGHLGGRIRVPHGPNLRFSAEGDLPTAMLAEAIREQSQPSISSQLNVQTATEAFANAKLAGDDTHFGWCYGLLLGLSGQTAKARSWITSASANLNKLRKAWTAEHMDPADWAEAGAHELSLLLSLLDDQPAFERHCAVNAERNAAKLGLQTPAHSSSGA